MSQFEATKQLKGILTDYFQEFFADAPAKVAWCSSVGPSEILISMGFKVYFPENHGALLGATRTSNDFIPVANAQGYSPDICSYLTSDIGAFLKGETPLTKAYGIPSIPRPDLLVYNTNQCREVQDWFSFYARHFAVPAWGIFSPWKIDQLGDTEIDFVEKQFHELIQKIESHFDLRFDLDRLREVVALSGKTSALWHRFLQKAKHAPSPITFFDGCIQMAPAVMLRGLPVAVDYYERLNQEVDALGANVQAPKSPQIRFYWEGMPIWGKLRFFADLFARLNANVVASTYCNSWVFDMSEHDPLRSMAKAYTNIFINRSETAKEILLKTLTDEFTIDGVIHHDAKTCPYNSNSRFGLPERMSKKYQMPYLVVHGDLNDLRCFSQAHTETAVEAFVDQINEMKVHQL